ncbi:hypothetical protein OJ996_00715 [Luteolibacter sp. GHJ8]|uniref:Uncharacterized protein n=1 Tax=Luteolibacter rhizosphaerae TaxID=2989719 RepID=A0ABT3FXU6_9BACT|nr:hypothetical protein [Luteolibacter rhizosphaerae]MCW1912074.1 hypothetical protein [Luteolibacter rhizosphaerae]
MKRILTHAFALLVGVALAASLPRLIHPQARADSENPGDES